MARRDYPKRWLVVGLSFVTLLVAIGGLTARTLGESSRTTAAVRAATGRINDNQARIEREARADCPFKLTFITLPEQSIRMGQKPNPIILELARNARAAFIGKGCPETLNPETGKPFGQPPEVRTG